MARTVTQNADLRFRGRDDGASQTVKKVKKEINALPTAFSKSAGALNLFSSASDKMGGKVADATGKLADIGALAATGGPVGIAIAAVTAATGLAIWAWSEFGDETETAAEKQIRLNEVMKKARERVEGLKEEIENLTDALTYYNQTPVEKTISQQRELVAGSEERIRSLQGQIKMLARMTKGLGSVVKVEKGHLEQLRTALPAEKIILEAMKEKLLLMEEAQGAAAIDKREAEEATEREKRLAEAKKAAAAAARELLAEEKRAAAERAALNKGAEKRLETLYGKREKLLDEYAKKRHAIAVKSGNEEIEIDEEVTARSGELAAQRLQAQQAVAGAMVSAMGTAAASMLTDSENAHKHMMGLILDAVQIAISAYALQGGAAAGASVASVPPLVPIVSAAVIGIIRALLTQMPSYQHGGVVPGIDTGVDSRLAAVRPNERIFEPDHNERMVRALERGTGGGITVIFQSVMPATSAEASRAARALNKQLRQSRAKGF